MNKWKIAAKVRNDRLYRQAIERQIARIFRTFEEETVTLDSLEKKKIQGESSLDKSSLLEKSSDVTTNNHLDSGTEKETPASGKFMYSKDVVVRILESFCIKPTLTDKELGFNRGRTKKGEVKYRKRHNEYHTEEALETKHAEFMTKSFDLLLRLTNFQLRKPSIKRKQKKSVSIPMGTTSSGEIDKNEANFDKVVVNSEANVSGGESATISRGKVVFNETVYEHRFDKNSAIGGPITNASFEEVDQSNQQLKTNVKPKRRATTMPKMRLTIEDEAEYKGSDEITTELLREESDQTIIDEEEVNNGNSNGEEEMIDIGDSNRKEVEVKEGSNNGNKVEIKEGNNKKGKKQRPTRRGTAMPTRELLVEDDNELEEKDEGTDYTTALEYNSDNSTGIESGLESDSSMFKSFADDSYVETEMEDTDNDNQEDANDSIIIKNVILDYQNLPIQEEKVIEANSQKVIAESNSFNYDSSTDQSEDESEKETEISPEYKTLVSLESLIVLLLRTITGHFHTIRNEASGALYDNNTQASQEVLTCDPTLDPFAVHGGYLNDDIDMLVYGSTGLLSDAEKAANSGANKSGTNKNLLLIDDDEEFYSEMRRYYSANRLSRPNLMQIVPETYIPPRLTEKSSHILDQIRAKNIEKLLAMGIRKKDIDKINTQVLSYPVTSSLIKDHIEAVRAYKMDLELNKDLGGNPEYRGDPSTQINHNQNFKLKMPVATKASLARMNRSHNRGNSASGCGRRGSCSSMNSMFSVSSSFSMYSSRSSSLRSIKPPKLTLSEVFQLLEKRRLDDLETKQIEKKKEEIDACTFKPKINEKSRALVGNTAYIELLQTHGQHLDFHLDIKPQNENDQGHKKQPSDELDCSNITTSSLGDSASMVRRKGSSISTNHRVQQSLLHGNAMYKKAIERIKERQEKIRKREQIMKDETLKECTFQPKLNKRQSCKSQNSNVKINGLENYLKRQKEGKKLNKERLHDKAALGFRANLYMDNKSTNLIFDDYHYHLAHMDEKYDAKHNKVLMSHNHAAGEIGHSHKRTKEETGWEPTQFDTFDLGRPKQLEMKLKLRDLKKKIIEEEEKLLLSAKHSHTRGNARQKAIERATALFKNGNLSEKLRSPRSPQAIMSKTTGKDSSKRLVHSQESNLGYEGNAQNNNSGTMTSMTRMKSKQTKQKFKSGKLKSALSGAGFVSNDASQESTKKVNIVGTENVNQDVLMYIDVTTAAQDKVRLAIQKDTDPITVANSFAGEYGLTDEAKGILENTLRTYVSNMLRVEYGM